MVHPLHMATVLEVATVLEAVTVLEAASIGLNHLLKKCQYLTPPMHP